MISVQKVVVPFDKTASQHRLTRSACKLMALYNPSPEVATKMLVEAERSHKKQSDGQHAIFPEQGISNIMPSSFLNPLLRSELNVSDDGWGAVSLCETNRLERRSLVSALKDDQFDLLPQAIKPGKDLLVHIRAATVGKANEADALGNSHPYSWGSLVFMHNGTMKTAAFSGQTTKQINTFLPEAKLDPQDSDSKRVFYFILSQINKRFHTLKAAELPVEKVLPIFAKSVHHLVNKQPLVLQQLKPAKQDPPINGIFSTGRSNNIMLALDKHTLIYKDGPPLFLSYLQNRKGDVTEALIATEPPKLKNRTWQELPDKYVYVLSSLPDATYEFSMYPFNYLMPSALEQFLQVLSSLQQTVKSKLIVFQGSLQQNKNVSTVLS